MLTCTSYRNSFYTYLIQGGVSNCFIHNKLAFENIATSACGSFYGLRAEVLCTYSSDNQMRNKQQKTIMK